MAKNLRHILSFSRLVVLDGLRRHALLGLVVLALASQVAGLLFYGMIPRDVGRASNDFVFSISWLSGLLFIFFHAVNATAWGEDRRVIHSILARPISRAEYVLGLFTGLAGLLLVLNLILGSLGWVVLILIRKGVDPAFFPDLSSSYYLLSWLGLYALELMILSVVLTFSGMVRGSFTVLLLTVSYYFTCNGLPVVRESLIARGILPGQGLAVMLKWMTAIFPDFDRFNYKMYVTVGENFPAALDLVINLGISIGYVCLMLWFACLIYQKRDLK